MAETTLAGMAAIFGRMAVNMQETQEGLEKAAQLIEKEAKRVIGTYEYGWPQLAPSTLAQKHANTPLLETGEMRASIQHNSDGREAHIGSNSDKAVWQELGTARGIPPRSFLAETARRKEGEVREIIGQAVFMRMIAP